MQKTWQLRLTLLSSCFSLFVVFVKFRCRFWNRNTIKLCPFIQQRKGKKHCWMVWFKNFLCIYWNHVIKPNKIFFLLNRNAWKTIAYLRQYCTRSMLSRVTDVVKYACGFDQFKSNGHTWCVSLWTLRFVV